MKKPNQSIKRINEQNPECLDVVWKLFNQGRAMERGWLRLVSHYVFLHEEKYVYEEAEGIGNSMLLCDISLFHDHHCVMM